MPARSKGRAKIEFQGRAFLWWVDNDKCLRILSRDKTFVIATPLETPRGSSPAIKVIGPEFPGLDPAERPVWLVGPPWTEDSLGARVDGLLRWSLNPGHDIVRLDLLGRDHPANGR